MEYQRHRALLEAQGQAQSQQAGLSGLNQRFGSIAQQQLASLDFGRPFVLEREYNAYNDTYTDRLRPVSEPVQETKPAKPKKRKDLDIPLRLELQQETDEALKDVLK